MQRQPFNAQSLTVHSQAIEARFGAIVSRFLDDVSATAAPAVVSLDEAHGHLVNARVVVAARPSERWHRLLEHFISKAAPPTTAATGPLEDVAQHTDRFPRDVLVAAAAFLAAEANDLEGRVLLLADKCRREAIGALLDDIVYKVGDVADVLIGRVDDGTWQEIFDADQAAFARRWADVIACLEHIRMAREELLDYLLRLTQKLVDGGLATEFDSSIGRQVGAEMVEAHFTGTETLSKTLDLITERLPSLLVSAPPGVDIASRASRLAGSVAVGYASALCERSHEEQDSIYRAGLRARRRAEHEWATSEAQFRTVFTTVTVGIWIADLKGDIIDANPALLRIFGYTHEKFTKLNFMSIVCPAEAANLGHVYGELVRGDRERFFIKKRFYRCDGSEIWTDLTVSLVRDESGAPAYQVAILDKPKKRKSATKRNRRCDEQPTQP